MKKQCNNWQKGLGVFLTMFILNTISSYSQTKFDLYNEGSSFTVTVPMTQDGVTLSTSGSTGSKNSTPPCSNESWEVSSLGKTYILSLGSGGLVNIDAGAGSTISNITILLSRNSTGTTVSQIGHAAFSADGSTWTEYSNVSADGYDYCDEITITPSATNYQYFSFGRGAIGGVSPSTNAEARVYYVIVTVSGGSCSGTTLTESPTSLSAGSISSSGFTVTWTAPTSVAALTYDVELYLGSSATGTPVQSQTGLSSASASFSGLDESTQYTVKVIANGNGTDDCGSTSETLTTSTIAYICTGTTLSTPISLAGSNETTSGFDASWSAVSNASSYTVKVYEGATLAKTVTGLTTTSTTFSDLSASTSYTFTVTAIGNGSSYCNSSESSSSSSVTTLDEPIASVCDYALYSTDFTDWNALDQSSASSGDTFNASGGGEGFILSAKPSVYPSTDLTGLGETGYLVSSNSSGTLLKSKSLTFVEGGSVVAYVYNTSTSDRNFSLTVDGSGTGITAVYDYLEPQAYPETTAAVISANNFKTGQNGSSDKRKILYKVTFTLPSTLTGEHTIEIIGGSLTGLTFTRLTICSGVGANPIITINPPADDDRSYSGLVNGDPIVQNNTVKGFNLVGDVKAEIVSKSGCDDVSRFSMTSSPIIIPQAQALSGITLPITYTPSSLISSHCAVLQLTSTNADTVFVTLNGVTGTTSPIITTPSSTILMASTLITTTTTTIDVTGLNLTSDVTLTISGTDASQFRVLNSSVDYSTANVVGQTVTIEYTGGYTAPDTHNAILTLSSTGAEDVVIPLVGKTFYAEPIYYTLTTDVSPVGSGFVRLDPVGPTYPSGTVVTITAIPERGYKFQKWGDVSTITPTRQVTMTMDRSVIAYFEESPEGGAVGDLEAYYPTAITSNSLAAHWSSVTGASSYVVTLYDQDGAVVESQTVTTTNYTFNVADASGVYSYRVVANTGDASDKSGPYLLQNPTFTCGQE